MRVVLLLLLLPACELVFPLRDKSDAGLDAPSPPGDVSPLDEGLIVHLSFDDPEGLTFDPRNDVTCSICPTPTQDRTGMESAATFASDACLEIPHKVELDPPQLTIALWLRVPVPPPDRQTVLARLRDDNGSMASFEITLDAALMVLPRIERAGLDPAIDQDWHHVAIASDGSTVETYLDGQPLGPVSSAPITYTESVLTIGCRNTLPAPQEFFNGDLDDIRIYRRALSPVEVSDLADD